MGIWAEIKHALNSTLGTDAFKPLNEIIREEILNGSGLVSSDNLYYPSIIKEDINIEENASYNKAVDVKLKFNVSGTVELRAMGSVSGLDPFQLNILKNNVVFQSLSFKNGASTTNSTILEFSKDDVFTFTIYGKGVGFGPSGSITASIYADVIDYSGITITNNI